MNRATSAIQAGARARAITAEDRNVNGSAVNWLIPISASCWRTSRATAFDRAAKITVSRIAATTVTSTPPHANRAPISQATPSTIRVCTTEVIDW